MIWPAIKTWTESKWLIHWSRRRSSFCRVSLMDRWQLKKLNCGAVSARSALEFVSLKVVLSFHYSLVGRFPKSLHKSVWGRSFDHRHGVSTTLTLITMIERMLLLDCGSEYGLQRRLGCRSSLSRTTHLGLCFTMEGRVGILRS